MDDIIVTIIKPYPKERERERERVKENYLALKPSHRRRRWECVSF